MADETRAVEARLLSMLPADARRSNSVDGFSSIGYSPMRI
jgi:hypothetical protein